MKNTWKRAAIVSMLSGLVGSGLFLAFATIFWQTHPYPDNADAPQINEVWVIHVIAEKLFGYLILIVCALGAAIPLRRNWRVGLAAAIGSGISYQMITMITYIVRFGPAYLDYNQFWSTVLPMIAFSSLFGFIAVWGSYRRENKEKKDNLNLLRGS